MTTTAVPDAKVARYYRRLRAAERRAQELRIELLAAEREVGALTSMMHKLMAERDATGR